MVTQNKKNVWNVMGSIWFYSALAAIAADGGGLSCDDGTMISADAVTPSAVAAATVQGVWTPRTTDGAPVRVVSAVRG